MQNIFNNLIKKNIFKIILIVEAILIIFYLPKVLDNTGKAELSRRTREQLRIIRLNGVLFTLGLIRFITGNAYKPTHEVAIKYRISTISTIAPNGPNFESELTPNVNC